MADGTTMNVEDCISSWQAGLLNFTFDMLLNWLVKYYAIEPPEANDCPIESPEVIQLPTLATE